MSTNEQVKIAEIAYLLMRANTVVFSACKAMQEVENFSAELKSKNYGTLDPVVKKTEERLGIAVEQLSPALEELLALSKVLPHMEQSFVRLFASTPFLPASITTYDVNRDDDPMDVMARARIVESGQEMLDVNKV